MNLSEMYEANDLLDENGYKSEYKTDTTNR